MTFSIMFLVIRLLVSIQFNSHTWPLKRVIILINNKFVLVDITEDNPFHHIFSIKVIIITAPSKRMSIRGFSA